MDTISLSAQMVIANLLSTQSFQSRMLTWAPVDVRLCLSGFETHVLFAVGGQWVWAQPWSMAERTVLRRYVEQGWNMMLVQRRRQEEDRFLEPVFLHRSVRLVDWDWIRVDCIEWDYETLAKNYKTILNHYENRCHLGLIPKDHCADSFVLHNQLVNSMVKNGVHPLWAGPQIIRPELYVLKPYVAYKEEQKKKKTVRSSRNYAEKIRDAILQEGSATFAPQKTQVDDGNVRSQPRFSFGSTVDA